MVLHAIFISHLLNDHQNFSTVFHNCLPVIILSACLLTLCTQASMRHHLAKCITAPFNLNTLLLTHQLLHLLPATRLHCPHLERCSLHIYPHPAPVAHITQLQLSDMTNNHLPLLHRLLQRNEVVRIHIHAVWFFF